MKFAIQNIPGCIPTLVRSRSLSHDITLLSYGLAYFDNSDLSRELLVHQNTVCGDAFFQHMTSYSDTY